MLWRCWKHWHIYVWALQPALNIDNVSTNDTIGLEQSYLFVQPMVDRGSVWEAFTQTVVIFEKLYTYQTVSLSKCQNWFMSHDKAFTIANKGLLMYLIYGLLQINLFLQTIKLHLYSWEEVITSNWVNMSMQENQRKRGLIVWDVTTDNRKRYWINVRSLAQTVDSLHFQLYQIPVKGGGMLESVCVNRWQALYGSQLWKEV